MKTKSYTLKSFFWELLEPYKHWYILILQGPLLSPVYSILYSYATKLIIDLFSSSKVLSFGDISYPFFLFVFAQIFLDVTLRIEDFAMFKSQPFVQKELISKVYNYVQYHSFEFFQTNQSGSLISRIKGVSDRYYVILRQAIGLFGQSFAKTIAYGGILLFINKWLFLMILTFGLSITIYYLCTFKKVSYLSRRCADGYHEIIAKIGDRVNNIFNLFSFATRKREFYLIRKQYDDIQIPRDKAYYRYDFVISLFASFIYWFYAIIIFLFLVYLKNKGAITTGDIAFAISMTYLFSEHIWLFFGECKDFMANIAQLRSSFAILAHPQEKDKHLKDISISRGEINFKNINFSYQEQNSETDEIVDSIIFENLNLHIKPGEKIGIIGYSGAGKSSLVSILLKYFKPSSGSIEIDGQNIADFNADSIRRQISIIPQEVMLFHRSIAENISYALDDNEVNMDMVIAASKMAEIHDIIEEMPEGYNTLVGERGLKLSGGQRQRVAIARAILKNAPILVLDEATSALDSQTESQIQESIHKMLLETNCTVIAIAHRLSTLKNMDRIIVLEDGNIVQEGSFQELILKNEGVFKELWESQTVNL